VLSLINQSINQKMVKTKGKNRLMMIKKREREREREIDDKK